MPIADIAVIHGIAYLPRLRTVLSDVLGIETGNAHLDLDLDLAEALACDEHDRAEVISAMDARFGVDISSVEAAGCESVADLLRLVIDSLNAFSPSGTIVTVPAGVGSARGWARVRHLGLTDQQERSP